MYKYKNYIKVHLEGVNIKIILEIRLEGVVV